MDTEALSRLEDYLPTIAKLGEDIHDTLTQGGRIFLCGCGATGRLSIALEVFCRQGLTQSKYKNRFIGFMAGGDVALIKSVENFEDRPDYGERQLKELGFKNGDLFNQLNRRRRNTVRYWCNRGSHKIIKEKTLVSLLQS